ncbi:3',5'-cyclic-nucleotide phosphodiesterase [Legionella beliardensis]|uniref:3',5'-cyclic-nucleotide phosphodiesterase n=1 Tax=Legionella beliardensis TaxID=91822 RepID=A0A378HXP5_9GAMM|nr:metallophosphoesterase [Legionella beliardensis]STX27698.1 3',5'-cyclic-nucleotide phosphodiesterase [Legionella beliardensis]
MKIIHISDLHFGMHYPHILTAFLEEISTLKPDAFIISGDLTQRAKTHQYEELKKFLEQLPGTTFIVPGNHDIPLHNPLARLLYPFRNYKHYVTSDMPVTFTNSEIRVLGINSVNPYQIKDGELSHKTLEVITRYFDTQDNKLNILFFHHNFDYLEGLHKPLQNDQEFLKYLKQSTVHIVCTGHLHYAHLGLIEKDNQDSCLVLHAGSLMCMRSKDGLNSYYIIENDGLACRIHWRVFCDKQFLTRSIHTIDFTKKRALLESLMQPAPEAS